MNFAQHSQLILATLVALMLPAAAQIESRTNQSPITPDKRPNIVLILADDLGYGSLGCYGNTEFKTPNIDRLAAGGIRLTDFHSNGSVCSPTRASLLTGRYQQRCAWVAEEELSPVFREQRQQNAPQRWAWGIATNEVTIGKLLKQAGYRTGLIGKWHLGYDVSFHPMNYGFDEFRGFMGGNVDYHTHIAGYGLKQLDWWNDREIKNEEGYTTDLLTRYATEFIARHKEQPFFLYVAYSAPHDPWQGRNPASTNSPAKTYREMIEVLDESVGRIAETLRNNHLDTNTLLIFCSDNGAAAPRGVTANGRLRGRKGSKNDGGMNEGGHRVPFIAAWPGVIPAGKTCGETVMTMDLLPTFVTLAAATPPPGHEIDGMDVLPLLKGERKAPVRALHWRYGNEWAVRQGAWKLIGKGTNAVTLVNLEADLAEKGNLLQERPKLVKDMMTLHQQWISEVGNE